MNLRKDLSLKSFANLVAKDLQKAIRMESADDHGICVCVTCGKKDIFKRMQGGHFIGGRGFSVLFVEANIHPQCERCNNHLHGNQTEYARFIADEYGEETLHELRALKGQIKKFTREELAIMRQGYKQRIKEQEKRLESV